MPLHDETYTQHMIDDTAIMPEQALEAFQKAFPLVRPHVERDRNRIVYTLRNSRMADQWLRTAERIIRELSLPLEACIQEWSRRGVVFEKSIEISYSI